MMKAATRYPPILETLCRWSWLLCLIPLLLLFPGLAARALEETTFGSWTAKCETVHENKLGGCFIFQNIVLRKGGQRVLQIAIGYVPNTAEPIALLSLPLGISLPPGVSIELSADKPIKFPVERCEPTGCRAGLKINGELLDALTRAEKLIVRFHDAQRQPIEVPLSLSGFSAGLAALRQEPTGKRDPGQ